MASGIQLLDLPTEILQAIALRTSHLLDHKYCALARLGRTCRSLYNISIPILYGNLDISELTEQSKDNLACELVKQPSLAALVQHLDYRENTKDRFLADVMYNEFAWDLGRRSSNRMFFRQLTNLKTVRLQYIPYQGAESGWLQNLQDVWLSFDGPTTVSDLLSGVSSVLGAPKICRMTISAKTHLLSEGMFVHDSSYRIQPYSSTLKILSFNMESIPRGVLEYIVRTPKKLESLVINIRDMWISEHDTDYTGVNDAIIYQQHSLRVLEILLPCTDPYEDEDGALLGILMSLHNFKHISSLSLSVDSLIGYVNCVHLQTLHTRKGLLLKTASFAAKLPRNLRELTVWIDEYYRCRFGDGHFVNVIKCILDQRTALRHLRVIRLRLMYTHHNCHLCFNNGKHTGAEYPFASSELQTCQGLCEKGGIFLDLEDLSWTNFRGQLICTTLTCNVVDDPLYIEWIERRKIAYEKDLHESCSNTMTIASIVASAIARNLEKTIKKVTDLMEQERREVKKLLEASAAKEALRETAHSCLENLAKVCITEDIALALLQVYEDVIIQHR